MILAMIFTGRDIEQEEQFSDPSPGTNAPDNSNDPDSEEVEREYNDNELVPDEDEEDDDKVEKDDDFEKNYGHLDNGQDDLSTPDSGDGVDNLE
ncbi:hypothetical protein [Desertivirga xinjiangensis]|uniref:hypothetical protein n=1 Tax=Desertivirga xinjiangensis TaxID=539206 RepID=UPI00210B50C4|nr:hypothetical protein [Pedobacter xinjiangensis]